MKDQTRQFQIQLQHTLLCLAPFFQVSLFKTVLWSSQHLEVSCRINDCPTEDQKSKGWFIYDFFIVRSIAFARCLAVTEHIYFWGRLVALMKNKKKETISTLRVSSKHHVTKQPRV